MESFRQIGFLGTGRLPNEPRSWIELLPSVLQATIGHERTLQPDDVSGILRDLLGKQYDETEQALRWYVRFFDCSGSPHG